VTDTAKRVARVLRRGKERCLRKHEEKMSLDIQEQKDAESEITTNLGHR
jgi:hypothetical protein